MPDIAIEERAATTPPPSREHSQRWTSIAADYAQPDSWRGTLQLLATLIPLAALWSVMVLSVEDFYWATLILSVPAAAFLVRLFIIQHDCGHLSYFASRRLNDLVGHVIGVLTLTPHGYWRRAHNIHHATSGNLDKRGIGEIDLHTVAEYFALPRWKRLAYRIYRHPITFLGVGPVYLFVIKNRLPLDLIRRYRGALPSVMVTNVAIAALIGGLGLWLGFAEALMIQLPIVLLSSLIGVWLFYVQHQFAETYWRRGKAWNFHEGAVLGSSHFDLPQPLRWLTANIGIHHIHHLSSRIPSYRLAECLAANAELRDVGRITLRDSFKCARLALWDEEAGRLVSFREARARRRAGALR